MPAAASAGRGVPLAERTVCRDEYGGWTILRAPNVAADADSLGVCRGR